MKLARKIILHSPIADERHLNQFVEDCLRDEVSLIAVVGPGCERVEEMIDWIVVGGGSAAERYVTTSSHPDEPLSNVREFVEFWEMVRGDPFQEVRL